MEAAQELISLSLNKQWRDDVCLKIEQLADEDNEVEIGPMNFEAQFFQNLFQLFNNNRFEALQASTFLT